MVLAVYRAGNGRGIVFTLGVIPEKYNNISVDEIASLQSDLRSICEFTMISAQKRRKRQSSRVPFIPGSVVVTSAGESWVTN